MTLYISLDVETDGPIPGQYSMLSLGAAAFRGGELLGTWQGNLLELPEARTCPNTMDWWARQDPAIWLAARDGAGPPMRKILEFADWSRSFGDKPTAVCYPAGFDWTFVYWYLKRYVGSSPFGMSAICMKVWAACKLGIPFREMTKKRMPREWFRDDAPHTHRAVDDAVEQGWLWVRMSE